VVEKLHHRTLVRRLKRKISLLQEREEKSRAKLSAALKKIQRLELGYKAKVVAQARIRNTKLVNAQSAAFMKLAAKLQKQLLQEAKAKRKQLQLAMGKLEKKLVKKLTRTKLSAKKPLAKVLRKKK
jgi:multidrug resistance efflux pump